MLYGQDRNQTRRLFVQAWHKHRQRLPLEPLEQLIAEVVALHPEYHALLEQEQAPLDRDYLPEAGQTNPFLHMGLHIAIREQLATGLPAGIIEVYRALLKTMPDRHAAEHRMIDCLAETLWQSQRSGLPPDEAAYLQRLRELLR